MSHSTLSSASGEAFADSFRAGHPRKSAGGVWRQAPGPNASGIVADLADRISSSATASARAPELLAQLDDRSAEVLRLRFGLNGGEPMTQSQIASSLGVSQQRVAQIEAAALKKLRH